MIEQPNEHNNEELCLIAEARAFFHSALVEQHILLNQAGVVSNADKHSKASVAIARGIADRLGTQQKRRKKLAGQSSGSRFEIVCKDFLEKRKGVQVYSVWLYRRYRSECSFQSGA